MSEPHRRRLIVVAVIENRSGDWLLCRMPRHRGVFPGQWALPGGGVDEGERLHAALERELREELGIRITRSRTITFKDDVRDKLHADGRRETLHMVFLIYHCHAASDDIRLSDEFDAYRWVHPDRLAEVDLDEITRSTLLTVRHVVRQGEEPLDTPHDTVPASFP